MCKNCLKLMELREVICWPHRQLLENLRFPIMKCCSVPASLQQGYRCTYSLAWCLVFLWDPQAKLWVLLTPLGYYESSQPRAVSKALVMRRQECLEAALTDLMLTRASPPLSSFLPPCSFPSSLPASAPVVLPAEPGSPMLDYWVEASAQYVVKQRHCFPEVHWQQCVWCHLDPFWKAEYHDSGTRGDQLDIIHHLFKIPLFFLFLRKILLLKYNKYLELPSFNCILAEHWAVFNTILVRQLSLQLRLDFPYRQLKDLVVPQTIRITMINMDSIWCRIHYNQRTQVNIVIIIDICKRKSVIKTVLALLL